VRDKFRITLSRDEVLALDHYFTWRVGWIGHEEPADLVANQFADIISGMAKEIQKEDENHRD
jgi:hypothetical protein